MRVFQQPCYVLLNRPFSETSFIVEVFSRDHGRLALMAKGARRLKSKLKGDLLPFQPLLISWSGKGEMPTLTAVELDQSSQWFYRYELRQDSLVCGLYCNEVLVKLLHRHDPHPRLYDQYAITIQSLAKSQTQSVDEQAERRANCLRQYEQVALKEAGYAVDFLTDANDQSHINNDDCYRFHAGLGFVKTTAHDGQAVSGKVVKSLHDLHEHEAPLPPQAKHLMRSIMQQVMGGAKITSRALFFPRQTSRH